MKVFFNRKTLLLVIAISFCTLTSIAHAYTSYGIRGCGKLISEVDTTSDKDRHLRDITEIAVKNWIAGYVTSYNAWLEGITNKEDSNVIKNTDIVGVYMSIINYCRANPLRDTNDAMTDTINQLTPKSKSPTPRK